MILIQAHSLSKRYENNLVFKDLSFETVSPVVGIAGENGAGKSTLLKILAGLLKPASGFIQWKKDGLEWDYTKFKKSLGFLAPYVQLYEELTVYENLAFILKLRNQGCMDKIEGLLSSLDAIQFAHSRYASLSTGQQQRAKLAAALVYEPHVLMMDEPGSNLDAKGKKNVEEIVERYRSTDSMIVIASNLNYELDLCDQVIELKR